jgi:hypothetical protein
LIVFKVAAALFVVVIVVLCCVVDQLVVYVPWLQHIYFVYSKLKQLVYVVSMLRCRLCTALCCIAATPAFSASSSAESMALYTLEVIQKFE